MDEPLIELYHPTCAWKLSQEPAEKNVQELINYQRETKTRVEGKEAKAGTCLTDWNRDLS